jgi:hypothetical protein
LGDKRVHPWRSDELFETFWRAKVGWDSRAASPSVREEEVSCMLSRKEKSGTLGLMIIVGQISKIITKMDDMMLRRSPDLTVKKLGHFNPRNCHS